MPFRTNSFVGVMLADADLRDLDDNCDLTRATLTSCALGSLAGARLAGTRFVDCDLRAVTLANAVIDHTRFVRCLFDERGLHRVTPRITGPYLVTAPQLEWNPGVRGGGDSGIVETAFWHGSADRDEAFEVAWEHAGARCTATMMHMSVVFGFKEPGPHGAGGGGAIRFDALLRDGPPDAWHMPAEHWRALRDAIASRLPRWRPPEDST